VSEKELAYLGYEDPLFFCKYFLEHLFPKDIPWFHQGILAILTRRTDFLQKYGHFAKIQKHFKNRDGSFIFDSNGALNLRRFTLIMLPRGFSKTTTAGVAAGLWNVLYETFPFACYVSNAAPHAKMQLTNIKRELVDNQRILDVFGERRPDRQADQKWTEEFFETISGVAMAARGRGGQIRGLNHLGQRPKLIVVDDLEDLESVATEEQREKTRLWAYGDLLPALPELDSDATIVALGTLLHPNSLLMTWASDPAWNAIVFGAKDSDGDLLWPEMLDEEKLAARKLSFAAAGQSHVYQMEYFNQAIDSDTQPFKSHYIKIAPLDCPISELQAVSIYIDPAISTAKKADETVIVVVGMTQNGKIFLLDAWGKRGASEREKVDKYFDFYSQYKPRFCGVESTAYQAALVHILREEMFRKGTYFEITPVTHKVKKEIRIQGILQPRYASGYITHVKRFPELESQLFDFPRGAHDDWPDALAGAISLLDPVAAAAAGDKDLAEDTLEPLTDEWRLYA
jgi:predicted phage terminase large subunit-like protein